MLSIWKPTEMFQESLDGQPLATSLSDLAWDFPYERLPTSKSSNSWISLFLRPEGVLALLVFYLNSKPLVQKLYEHIKPTKGQAWFTASVAFHNLTLAIFSAVVAFYSWWIVADHWSRRGFADLYCDPQGALWQESGFGAWATLFYLSKYYEFIDSWILVLKEGKTPSFLQVYHHTGVCFCVWVGTVSQGSWLIVVVLFNSVIHTLMYTYFFIKTLYPQADIPAAKYLTRAQLGQFWLGMAITCPILFLGDSCNSASSRLGVACSIVYAMGLVVLFMSFAKVKYSKGAPAAKTTV